MKKHLLFLCLALSAAFAMANTVTILVDQNFEGLAEGMALGQGDMVAAPDNDWGKVYSDGATIFDFNGNKVLKVETTESGQGGIAIPIDDSILLNADGNYVNISFKRYQTKGNTLSLMQLNANENATSTLDDMARPVLNFENEGLQLNFVKNGCNLSFEESQRGFTTSFPRVLKEDCWQTFLFKIDMSTGFVDFYLDGKFQKHDQYELIIKRYDGMKLLVFANAADATISSIPPVYYDDVRVEFEEVGKELIRQIDFSDYQEGQTLEEIAPEWLHQVEAGADCYITNLVIDESGVDFVCLYIPAIHNTGFIADVPGEDYEGRTLVAQFGYLSEVMDGWYHFDISDSEGKIFWRFWDNWHWKTCFKVDGSRDNQEIQYGNDGPIKKWCINNFFFNEDATLYRMGRIDTGNPGNAFRAIGGYDFYNSPDHTFDYNDLNAGGGVRGVGYYHIWDWGQQWPRFVSHLTVYAVEEEIPEPGLLGLALIALVAFLCKR